MSEDLKSIAEVLAETGFKPRAPNYDFEPDYAAIEAEVWEKEKPKIWQIMLDRGVPYICVEWLQSPQLIGNQAMTISQAFLDDPHQLLLMFIGSPGTGKSIASAYALRTRTKWITTQYGGPQTEYMKSIGMRAEPALRWQKWDTRFLWIRANQLGALADRFDNEVKARLRKLETEKVLVIDEVGGESWGDSKKRLDDLIGKRFDAQLKTIMTSNMDPPALRDALGDRVVARIRQLGRVVEVKDFR